MIQPLQIMNSAATWILTIQDKPSDIVAVVTKSREYAILFKSTPELLELAKELLDVLKSEFEGIGGRDLTGGRIKEVEDIIARIEGSL